MANFFDQFDEPAGQPRAGAPAQAGNYFDQFDEAPTRGSGLVMNATAGLNEGIYGTMGAPVDAMTWLLNKGIGGVNAVSGADLPEIQNPIGGSRSIAKGFGAVGVPDPQSVQAITPGEKVARSAGQGAGYMLAPELAVRGGAQALGRTVSPYLEAMFGRSASLPDAAGNAVVGAVAGGAGNAAGQIAPEPLKPYAEMAGGILGGGAGAVAVNTPRIAGEGVRMARDYMAPLSQGGRDDLAAAVLRQAANNPHAAREALEAGPRELVPGSKPTTFQQTGDMGLGSLERDVRNRHGAEFQQRTADQNSARLSAMEAIQPAGSPEAVVTTLRQTLADLDRSTSQALEAATVTARERTAALGGAGTPEGYGATTRQHLADAEKATRERERALWGAVDPEGTLALPAGDIRLEAIRVVKEMPEAARPMEGEERAIIGAALNFKEVMPFKEVTALRSRVSTEMRQELSQNGQTPVYARLARLRGAIERQIEAAVERKAAKETEAVASGAMREEDTMAANMLRDIQAWHERRAVEAGVGQDTGTVGGGNAASGSGGARPAPGGQIPRGGQFRDASGGQGVQSPNPLTPNFDEAALGRLKDASAATKQRAETFGRGPVGDTLRRSGKDGPYNAPTSVVPAKFFRPGPRGYEDAQALRQATNSPEAMAAIRDYAVSTLRKAAERPDGSLDPSKVETWRRSHADALRAFPDIDGALRSPVEASQTMARLAVERKQALERQQAGVLGRIIGAQAPEDVTRMVGGIFSSQQSVTTMRRVVSEVGRNAEAMTGLRKAVADHIVTRLKSTTEAATSGQELLKAGEFQKFVRSNENALREVFKPEEVESLKAIAADLMRANRSRDAVRLPGQSNTPQDLFARERFSDEPSWLHRILAAAGPAGAVMFATSSATAGLAAAIAGNAVVQARKAGLQKVDDIIADAMLNPDRAALLLSRPSNEREAAEIGRRIVESYRRAAILPAIQAEGENAPAGRIARLLTNGPTRKPEVSETARPVVDALMGAGAAK